MFAGLPFLSWSGSYGIHGPIDNYRAANGGSLRRGFVSHGCIRMEAADIVEVYGRIRTLASVPVHVQREPERDAAGQRIDVPEPWLGAECATDDDCPYAGGFCSRNAYSQRGFCSAHCSKYCSDKPGAPVSFCVADPSAPGNGMCVQKESALNRDCRPLDHFVPETLPRMSQPSVTARVCVPGSRGSIGDHCYADGDCLEGNSCQGALGDVPGLCTQACTKYCPDEPGFPTTFCVDEPLLGGTSCVRQCSTSSNASECPAGTRCELRTRNGSTVAREVCVPE